MSVNRKKLHEAVKKFISPATNKNLHEMVTKSGSPDIQQLQMPPQQPRQVCVISPTSWAGSDWLPSFKIWQKRKHQLSWPTYSL